jgi:hypothetical protein
VAVALSHHEREMLDGIAHQITPGDLGAIGGWINRRPGRVSVPPPRYSAAAVRR